MPGRDGSRHSIVGCQNSIARVAHPGLPLAVDQRVGVARDLEALRTPGRVAGGLAGVEGQGGGEQEGGGHTVGQVVG